MASPRQLCLENARKEIGLKALEKVANAFDMKPWQLLKGL